MISNIFAKKTPQTNTTCMGAHAQVRKALRCLQQALFSTVSRSLHIRKAKAAYLAGEDIAVEQTEWREALFHQEYEDRHEIHG